LRIIYTGPSAKQGGVRKEHGCGLVTVGCFVGR
jgi:hypothetical protein